MYLWLWLYAEGPGTGLLDLNLRVDSVLTEHSRTLDWEMCPNNTLLSAVWVSATIEIRVNLFME